MEFVTIKESTYVSDLAVLTSLLEANGVRCFLKDEFSSQVLNFMPMMSVKLQVAREDLPKVEKILREAEEGQNEE
ncbi:MAG: DUF2007 domain-containing protein [Chlorobi bacterium]|nr:DUF2007 domain-containing protein [Chlorobiota bacterium]